MADHNGKGSIDFPSDDEQDTGREVDAAALAAGLSFSAMALPIGLSFAKAAAIEAQARMAQQLEGAENFMLVGNADAKTTLSRAEREKEADDRLSSYASMVIEQDKRQRERAWDQSRVTIGGVGMTGAEWDKALELLSDPRSRDRLVEYMTGKKGWTKERAEKAADDALTLAQIVRRRKDGTITPADEAKAGEIARNNPDAVIMVKESARLRNVWGAEIEDSTSLTVESELSTDIGTATATYQKMVAEAPTTDGNYPFAKAPDLGARFESARDSTLAQPRLEPVKPASQLVAKFDMDSTF